MLFKTREEFKDLISRKIIRLMFTPEKEDINKRGTHLGSSFI